MPWDVYVQAGLGFMFFILSFGRRVKQVAIMEMERDIQSGKKTQGHQAWIRRNLPAFYRAMGVLLMGCALLLYLMSAKPA